MPIRPVSPAEQPTAASAGGQTLSLQQTEALVAANLASALKLAPEQIGVVSSEQRTWPDQGLGCAARKGVYEPAAVAGYLITLEHAGQTYRYHTDQAGRFIRCDPAGKPVGPIR